MVVMTMVAMIVMVVVTSGDCDVYDGGGGGEDYEDIGWW